MSEALAATDRVASRRGKTALITGISGQDGALLAQLLLEKGYVVTGTTRSLRSMNPWRLDELGIRQHPRLKLFELDPSDFDACLRAIDTSQPAEVYNLGGVSFIGHSFKEPLATARALGLGAWNLLEAIRKERPIARFFQASSSEMFGDPSESPQDERTCLRPASPYAASKVHAHWATACYRESYGLFASSGILYNHESTLRGIEFVTRKIARGAALIGKGMKDCLELGNLESMRDWGYAPEYVDAMWRILNVDTADSFVLATGRATSVRSYVEFSFKAAGIQLEWRGSGFGETGVDVASGKIRIRVSKEYYRATDTRGLCGNAHKAESLLSWKAMTKIDEISRLMVEAEVKRLGRGSVE